jgi:hypothetical protein
VTNAAVEEGEKNDAKANVNVKRNENTDYQSTKMDARLHAVDVHREPTNPASKKQIQNSMNKVRKCRDR